LGTLLVVDGSDVCRAPMVEFLLRQGLAGAGPDLRVLSRGLDARPGDTMCDSASTRLGFSGPALAFYGAHRAEPLTRDDIAGADLVLTAERAQRSAVVRALPGTQAMVFTLREAAALLDAALRRRDPGVPLDVRGLADVARILHGVRGTVPMVEPAVRTRPFHWRRATDQDPLTIEDGHAAAADHRRITQQAFTVAVGLAEGFVQLGRAAISKDQVARSA
jgi:protein-tyrosine-phosphatase